MEFLGAFLIVMVFMFVGEWVSSLTKAYVPSIFISAVLFTIGFWTILPKDIVAKASFGGEFVGVCIPILLVHLGTMMNIRQLLNQWRAVTIALSGTLGTIILTLTIGTVLFDWHTVIAAIPPLTGGLVSALLMTDGLKAAGLSSLVALPVSMFIMHSMIGYPLTSVMLKKEGRRLLREYRGNPQVTVAEKEAVDTEPKALFKLPAKYNTSAFMLAKVGVVGLLSIWLAGLMNGAINANVIALVLGVVGHQIGFLEKEILNKTKVFNWLMYGLMAYVLSQLSVTTPDMLGTILIQIVVLIILGIFGMFVASWVLSKPMKMSKEMAFASSLTALFGFPADYVLTNEVIGHLTTDENERSYLTSYMMPKMLVGGFATVSVASVIIASVFLKLL
ncbi:hypothetical protein [Weissella sagaensis]|uniref:Na+/glutamate symporter n=1 Tax=Weissella sagaensis TaxID=2559928 RepID=A0ABW1RV46_9LACO|nr:hypothetical protein [Weissella sagaensis]QDJ59624.1 hypothetical protein EFA59_08960 [Weissella hellenica]QEA56937.1 hypothetical protein FGL75_03145 [Weissella hellenica]UEG67752.1 hypothetical protein GZH44_04405 [Weissella hellenica]